MPQGRSGQVWKISPSPGFDPRTVQPVGSRYTDNASRSHLISGGKINKNHLSFLTANIIKTIFTDSVLTSICSLTKVTGQFYLAWKSNENSCKEPNCTITQYKPKKCTFSTLMFELVSFWNFSTSFETGCSSSGRQLYVQLWYCMFYTWGRVVA